MPLTFRKSIRILPGVRLNINRRSWSITTGGRHGPRRTHSSTGRRTTSMDLPGPFGWRRTATRGRRHSRPGRQYLRPGRQYLRPGRQYLRPGRH